MRGSKAKKIRKIVYGDNSLTAKRKYVLKIAKNKFDDVVNRIIINDPKGLRAKYLEAKRLVKLGVRI